MDSLLYIVPLLPPVVFSSQAAAEPPYLPALPVTQKQLQN